MDYEKILFADNKLEENSESEKTQEALEETCRLDYGYVLDKSERLTEKTLLQEDKIPLLTDALNKFFSEYEDVVMKLQDEEVTGNIERWDNFSKEVSSNIFKFLEKRFAKNEAEGFIGFVDDKGNPITVANTPDGLLLKVQNVVTRTKHVLCTDGNGKQVSISKSFPYLEKVLRTHVGNMWTGRKLLEDVFKTLLSGNEFIGGIAPDAIHTPHTVSKFA